MHLKKEDIKGIMTRDFAWVPGLKNKLHIVDNFYTPVNRTFVLNTIKHDEWLKPNTSYQAEVFDCDDYAMYLKCKLAQIFVNNQEAFPAALGFLITTRHAFNFSIDNKKQITLFDTVNTKQKSEANHFKEFLNYKPGNTIKLIYL